MVSEITYLKQKYWCTSCKRKPSCVKKAVDLMENMNSYIEFLGQNWLLCQQCEAYTHTKCYTRLYSLTDKEIATDIAYFKTGGRFFCSKCRQQI